MNKTARSSIVAAIAASAVCAVSAFWACSGNKKQPEEFKGKLVVRFFDVGQGDAGLITLPDEENILVDAGDHGAPTVQYLKDIPVRDIAIAVATHPHSDHIGEMRRVLQQFTVHTFWNSGLPYFTETYQHLLDEIESQHIPLEEPKAGYDTTIGGATLQVVAPEAGAHIENDSVNNASIVFRLTYKTETFLFAGDAETASWQKMIVQRPAWLRATVLKAAHHGSSNGTTEAVLEAVNPSYIVISCGKGNDYHHPHPHTMELLRAAAAHTRLFRTDLEGTITMISDGNTINVRTEKTCPPEMLYKTGDETAELP